MIRRFKRAGRHGVALTLAAPAAVAWSLAGIMRGCGIAAATAAAVVAAAAPAAAADVRDQKVEALSQRLFPALSAVGGSEETVARLRARAELRSVLDRRASRITACKGNHLCQAEVALWQADEMAALADAVATEARALLHERGLVPDDGIKAGVTRELEGLNGIIRVYALGMPGSYPAIDGPLVPFGSPEARTRLKAALSLAGLSRVGSAQALDPSVELALALLDAHDRLDAIGFEPIEGGENAAATARAQTIDWSRYRYTAIIVPGIGPDMENLPLSAGGKYHVRLAAERFAEGDAPFIIVSGGRAHPRATPYVEALEMRRALIERYGVPADAIVIEPYARHTTTNLRNAARRLIALGAPLDRDTLIVCNPDQSRNIESPAFVERNQRELGYQPGTVGKRLSPTELVFRPSAVSARVDPHDPLDP